MAQKPWQDKTWLRMAQPTACRFGFTIQESSNPLEKKNKSPGGSSPLEKGSSRNSLVGHSSRKASLGKEGKASSHTHQAFTHLQSTLSSEGICHYITSHGVTCKKHLPSSLFRQGASQCRPMLPRANSAIEKKHKLLSFSRAASAGQPALPSTALLQGTASFIGQP